MGIHIEQNYLTFYHNYCVKITFNYENYLSLYPHKLGDLNHHLINRIKDLGFKVTCAVTHTPQDIPYPKMFKRNVELIKKADIFVAVLKDYGKDLTAETGIAYGLGKMMIGLDFNADKKDVMSYYAFNKIIKPKDLEKVLSKLKD